VQGLKLGSFRYWIRRIRKDERSDSEGTEAPSSRPAVRFATVRRVGSELRAEDAQRSPSGVRVRIGEAEVEVDCVFDAAALRCVLRALKEER